MFERLRSRKSKSSNGRNDSKTRETSSEKIQSVKARPFSAVNISQSSPTNTERSQRGKRDASGSNSTKVQTDRKRFSWSDNSNARSATSSTSNDDDQSHAKSHISEASRRRHPSTPSRLRNLGARFSWSDSSQSKISVTSISGDEDNLVTRPRSPDLGQTDKVPTTLPAPISKLKNFGRKLSRNDVYQSSRKQRVTSTKEIFQSSESELPRSSTEPRPSTARRFSRLSEFSVSEKAIAPSGVSGVPNRSAITSRQSANSSLIGPPKAADNLPRLSPNHESVTTDRSQAFPKRHSWAAPSLNNGSFVAQELSDNNGPASSGSPAPAQTIVIRRPLAVERQDSMKRLSWSQINEERSKALSILEEGSSSPSRKSIADITTVPRPPSNRRPSTIDRLEAFKKRHSLSDYKQLRGRPFSGSSNIDPAPARTWSPGTKPRPPSPPRRTSTSDQIRSLSRRLSTPISIWGSSVDPDAAFESDIDTRVTKIVSSETFQLRRSNAALIPLLPPQPAHMTAQSSPLLSLPTELLHQLPPYLPPSAVVSLRQTCSRLHTVLGLLPHSSSSSLSPSSTFAFLLMLDRDNLTTYSPSHPPRLLCGHCRRLHPRSAFPAAHISLHPLRRSCRQLWLCPHKSYTHPRAAKLLRPPRDSNTLFITKNIDPCPRCRDNIRHRVAADPSNTILTTKIALLQRPTPLPRRGQAPDVFPVKDVSAALQALNFRICPHIRISDHLLLSRFCRVCLSTRSVKANGRCIQDCNSERLNTTGYGGGKCKGQCFKKGCNSGWMFQARESLKPDATGRRQVWLVLGVWRGLGKLKIQDDDDDSGVDEIISDPDEEAGDEKTDATRNAGPDPGTGDKEPAWVDHTVDVPERAAMRKHWEEWNRGSGGGGKCLPDWSICLLHPEDGGLGIGVT